MAKGKAIYHATFYCRYKYKYNLAEPTQNFKFGPYTYIKDFLYLEGQEKARWEEIKIHLGHSKRKIVSFVEQELRNKKVVGHQVTRNGKEKEQ